MNIIFLDIDGVLNCHDLLYREGMDAIGDEFLDRLRHIVSRTEAQLVLSSMWRLSEKNLNLVKKALSTRNLVLLDCTIEIERGWEFVRRSEEIQEWLDRHPEVQKFAILDDWDDAAINGNFFQTNMDDGLTDEIAKKIMEHFKNE